MLFSLEVRRALKGDCLMLHFGDPQKPSLILIDGGPRGVYGQHLKPRLETLRTKRGIPDNKALQIDAVMVSHVDDDHIQGILNLTKELLEAKAERRPPMVRILDLLHNSFDDIIDHKPDELTASVSSQFGAAALSGDAEMSDDAVSEVEDNFARDNPGIDEDEQIEMVASTLGVLASVKQGYQLRADAQALGIERNLEFGGKLIIAREDNPPVDMGEGLTFTFVGPMKDEVEALRKDHNKWLKELKKDGVAVPHAQALAAYVDPSVPNLSSIVVLAEAGGKSMLLTGDARGDKILEGLEFAGVIEQGGQLNVDLLKVPHHGSANNLDDDFFERIVAKHYVFSGNGEHGNPERESLEMLLNARGDADYTIHLTYPIEDIDVERKKDWEKEQNKQKTRKKRNSHQVVRPNWSPDTNGLDSFFNAHPSFKAKVSIVAEDDPHIIDLLDEFPFRSADDGG